MADTPKGDSKKNAELLKDAKECFDQTVQYEDENRTAYKDDTEFARLAKQWPDDIVTKRKNERRPTLTINKMPAFIRQVVNDQRQNKPSVKVHPVDSVADPYTARVFSGLIRNIEYSSNADVAYDTAADCAVTGGFGYWRVGLDYTYDDSFDLDVTIDRVADPLRIYGDPASVEADSCDWCTAFCVEPMKKADFERDYKGAEKVDWNAEGYTELTDPWFTEETVLVAEWWKRDKVNRDIVLLDDGVVLDAERLASDPILQAMLQMGTLKVQGERKTQSWRVTQYIMTGAEILETKPWPGRYIPIVPVYGDEVWVDGKRYFRSLIRDAKDPQRMHNYWRTTSTELVALAPKTPFIGKKGAFKTDANKWATANTESHSYIEYDGDEAPQRQPFAGPAAGALQEALNASDDMKAIMGLYDSSLGARSNETSGRAIIARQREGDVSNFHFQDNVARAIRHTGRILIDIIPKVYGQRKMLRILGEDGVPLMQSMLAPTQVTGVGGQPQRDSSGNPMSKVFDLTVGKYDLTVTTGPSFTTRREEAANQMIEMVRAFPQAAALVGDLIAKNLDWPGADEMAERFKAMLPPQITGQGVPPQIQEQMGKLTEIVQKLMTENTELKADKSIEAGKLALQGQKNEIDEYRAKTDRMEAIVDATRPHKPAQYTS